jgi:hypothetical protein
VGCAIFFKNVESNLFLLASNVCYLNFSSPSASTVTKKNSAATTPLRAMVSVVLVGRTGQILRDVTKKQAQLDASFLRFVLLDAKMPREKGRASMVWKKIHEELIR